MLKFFEEHFLNPLFIYIVSFIICFAWTGFDTSNLAGLAGFAIIGMVPASVIIGAIAGLILF